MMFGIGLAVLLGTRIFAGEMTHVEAQKWASPQIRAQLLQSVRREFSDYAAPPADLIGALHRLEANPRLTYSEIFMLAPLLDKLSEGPTSEKIRNFRGFRGAVQTDNLKLVDAILEHEKSEDETDIVYREHLAQLNLLALRKRGRMSRILAPDFDFSGAKSKAEDSYTRLLGRSGRADLPRDTEDLVHVREFARDLKAEQSPAWAYLFLTRTAPGALDELVRLGHITKHHEARQEAIEALMSVPNLPVFKVRRYGDVIRIAELSMDAGVITYTIALLRREIKNNIFARELIREEEEIMRLRLALLDVLRPGDLDRSVWRGSDRTAQNAILPEVPVKPDVQKLFKQRFAYAGATAAVVMAYLLLGAAGVLPWTFGVRLTLIGFLLTAFSLAFIGLCLAKINGVFLHSK